MPLNYDDNFYVKLGMGQDDIAMALLQKYFETSLMWPIQFTSKVITTNEEGYMNMEQLMMVIIFVVRKFWSYVIDKHNR